MNLQQVRQMLLEPPTPGHVRLMRVDSRLFSPDTWHRLPCPQDDCYPPQPGWARNGWQCAADYTTVAKWWPDDALSYNLKCGACLRVLEVPVHECHHCGNQYVFNPAAAKDILQ